MVAAKSLPAGTVLTAGDLATASIPASGHITAMAATGSSVVVGQQLDTPVYAGQVLVRQMLAATPQLASGEQVVGMLLKGDQMPSVPLVAGDVVQVVAVPQAGQGSTIGGTHRADAGPLGHRVRRRTRTGQPDPVRGVGLAGDPRLGRSPGHLLCGRRPDRALSGQRGVRK